MIRPLSMGPPLVDVMLMQALMRRQELDGFIEGLFGREEMIDLPKHAHRGLDELGQMRALFEAVVVLALDNAKQATDRGPGDDASTHS